MFFLASSPINLIVASSIVNACIIFLLSEVASPESNKIPVFPLIIVSLDQPILLAIINFFIDCASTATLPNASGSIDAETTISDTL